LYCVCSFQPNITPVAEVLTKAMGVFWVMARVVKYRVEELNKGKEVQSYFLADTKVIACVFFFVARVARTCICNLAHVQCHPIDSPHTHLYGLWCIIMCCSIIFFYLLSCACVENIQNETITIKTTSWRSLNTQAEVQNMIKDKTVVTAKITAKSGYFNLDVICASGGERVGEN
jgi:hypothetical protein